MKKSRFPGHKIDDIGHHIDFPAQLLYVEFTKSSAENCNDAGFTPAVIGALLSTVSPAAIFASERKAY